MESIYTIGHSNHKKEYFLKLLDSYKINCVVDVRSIPYSKYTSQFNKENIAKFLNNNKIYYIPMGDQLGARYENKSLFNNDGVLSFSKVRKTKNYQNGIDRLVDGLKKGFNIALMCTEKNPIDCHRAILISYTLKKMNIKVKHILENGSIKTHSDLEKDLLSMYNKEVNYINMFKPQKNSSLEDRLEKAYIKRNYEIGYSLNEKIKKEG